MEHDVVQTEGSLQRLLDNPWVLLAIGVTIPCVSYSVLGWLELWGLPPVTLP
jgi:hypothetical protein